MSFRVHFVHAPDPRLSEHQNFGNKYMPIWAFVLASHVPEDDGLELDVFDTRISPASEVTEADVFVYSGLNQDLDHLLETRTALARRYPRARHMIGGPICWSLDKAGELDKLDAFDHRVIGDGEEVIASLLGQLRCEAALPDVTRVPKRFDLAGARPMHRRLTEKYAGHYYGATVEVSRGCPFLCEFCDIRILQDNNRAHNKSPEVIVEEMDALAKVGMTEFMFACDNFIGELTWAHEVCDRILDWIDETGVRPSILTWLTINLYKDEELMAKMRRAGFDVIFIGVESFNQNSLLETAKVQNCTRLELPDLLLRIQAYGFIVTPGLIFGFDSDTEDLYELTIRGMEEAGLLTSNPGILVALPGTPLYRRMKLAGRLRSVDQHIGRFNFQSNVRYLLPKKLLVEGYIDFVQRVSDGAHQYQRLVTYFDNLDRDRFIPLAGSGYGNLFEYFRGLLRNRVALASFAKRLAFFATNPRHLIHLLKGLALVVRRRRRVPGGFKMFVIWVYGWSNFAMQYRRIRPEDFDIESVGGKVSREHILPDGYAENVVEDIPRNKTQAQLRSTVAQLERLVQPEPAA